MPIDISRFLLGPPPGGWEKEGRLHLDEEAQERIRKYRSMRNRIFARRCQQLSSLPPTWKDDFRENIFLFGRNLETEETKWLNTFLDHSETEGAFQKLLDNGVGWLDGIFFHIFIICRPASFNASKFNSILEDKDRLQKHEKYMKSLASYIEKVDKSSTDVGEFFGTMSQVIHSNLSKHGIKIIDENANQCLIPKMLSIIGASFRNHIRRTYRGPKFDHRIYWVVAGLTMTFRERFGRPFTPIVASLLNATFPNHDEKEYTDVKEILDTVRRRAKTAGMEEFVLWLSPPKNKAKGAIPAKKSKK